MVDRFALKNSIFSGFMGSALSFLRLQEPMWFSYYGPIRQAEASEALDDAIASQLQEIGSTTAIPIRKEVADKVHVPVGLNSPPFTGSDNNDIITVHFATSMRGKLVLTVVDSDSEVPVDNVGFGSDLDVSYDFPPFDEIASAVGTYNSDDRIELKVNMSFEFDVPKGVSARIYQISMKQGALPNIISDKIVIDGNMSTVSRVFHEDDDADNDFSDGLCLICCSNPATVIAFPCRHCCMCRSCSEKFATMSNHCPVCRSIVHELIDCSIPE